MALAVVKGDRTIDQITEQFDVHPNQITTWTGQLEGGAPEVFGAGYGMASVAPTIDIKALHANVGELTLESDCLEGALSTARLLNAGR